MEFVSLHSHTTFSFMDGYASPEAHVQRVAGLGMGSLALTEHGNVSSHVRHEKAALAAGIKPLFGCELYTGHTAEETRSRFKWHLGALAATDEGYRNLLRLVTLSWDNDHFFHEPTVDGRMLADHAEGLIILSGCNGSKIATDLLGGKGVPEHRPDLRAAEATAAKFRDCFGNAYYLEVQAFPELERCCDLNQSLERIGKRLGIPLVATADVHYPEASGNEMQLVLHAAGRGGLTADRQAANWEYDLRLTYPESDRALWRKLTDSGLSPAAAKQAILNSAAVAERCNVTLPKARKLRYPLPGKLTAAAELAQWLRRGLGQRGIGRHRSEYLERLTYEFRLIKQKDLCDFFLATADMIGWAKDQGIAIGPARGSAAASLVCYLLRITEIDPLKYPAMLIERFLDPDRVDMPDIDLDFESKRRDELRVYLEQKYGKECVGNIAGFTRYRGKLALNDVARTFGIPKHETAPLADLVAVRPDGDPRQEMSLADAVASFPRAAQVLKKYPDLQKALRLEGSLRGLTVHAAGLVVASQPLDEFVASYTRSSGTGTAKRNLRVVSADMKDVEYLGALKFDALGLTTMDVVSEALRLAGLPQEALAEIPDDDPAVMAAFGRADTVGIFQFDGRATRSVCRAVAPQTFMELSDINALSRPGCMASGTTSAYIKAGRGPRRGVHPLVGDVLAPTRGQLVYQEQLVNVLRFAGGFDWSRANAVRKIVAKKIGGGALATHRDDFLAGCSANGVGDGEARAFWQAMETSASYLFNTAHAVSYAKLAVWCMWLKAHHPLAWFCALLRHTPNDKQHERAFRTILNDARQHDIEVWNPHVISSQVTWEICNSAGVEGLLPGFSQIPGIGEATAAAILECRKQNCQNFRNWPDLIVVPGIGPKTVKKIAAFAEAADPFGLDRAEMVIGQITSAALAGQLRVPVPDCDSAALLSAARKRRNVVWAGLIRDREYKDEAELERERSGDTLEEVLARIKSPKLLTSAVFKCYDAGDEEVFVRVSRWDFPKLQKIVESAVPGRDAIVVRGEPSRGLSAAVRAKEIWIIEL